MNKTGKLYCIGLLLITAFVAGCSKKATPAKENYGVSGVSDITVRQYHDSTVKAVYHVAFPAGFFEPVTISIEDLPPGVTASQAVGTDSTSFDFTTFYDVHVNAAASYPVTIRLFSAFGEKVYHFNIIITPSDAFNYTLTGLHDISVTRYADTIVRMPVTAAYVSGIAEAVTVAADVLPAGVSVSPSALHGTPTFTDSFTFKVAANNTGTYPVTVHSTSAHSTTTASFNVHVTEGADCARPLSGIYTSETTCTTYSGPGTGISTANVTIAGQNLLLISLPFSYTYAELSCSTGTLNSGPSSSGGLSISGGTGTFNATTIVVNYAVSGTVNSNCKTVLSR